MRKILLTDGLQVQIRRVDEDETTIQLADQIKKLCAGDSYSYAEINKALYLADTELYLEALSKKN